MLAHIQGRQLVGSGIHFTVKPHKSDVCKFGSSGFRHMYCVVSLGFVRKTRVGSMCHIATDVVSILFLIEELILCTMG